LMGNYNDRNSYLRSEKNPAMETSIVRRFMHPFGSMPLCQIELSLQEKVVCLRMCGLLR